MEALLREALGRSDLVLPPHQDTPTGVEKSSHLEQSPHDHSGNSTQSISTITHTQLQEGSRRGEGYSIRKEGSNGSPEKPARM